MALIWASILLTGLCVLHALFLSSLVSCLSAISLQDRFLLSAGVKSLHEIHLKSNLHSPPEI